MKPTLHQIETNRRADRETSLRTGNGLPKTDYHFRPDSRTDFSGRCYGNPGPSFRRISDDYFKNEATGHFVSEAAVFGLIILTVAMPVIQSARGAFQFLHSVGVL